MAHHVHPIARLGAWVLISEGWYEPRRVGSIAHSAGVDGAVNGQQLSKQIGNPGKWREPGELGG